MKLLFGPRGRGSGLHLLQQSVVVGVEAQTPLPQLWHRHLAMRGTGLPDPAYILIVNFSLLISRVHVVALILPFEKGLKEDYVLRATECPVISSTFSQLWLRTLSPQMVWDGLMFPFTCFPRYVSAVSTQHVSSVLVIKLLTMKLRKSRGF